MSARHAIYPTRICFPAVVPTRALATDYDGTLACDGTVAPETFAALERYRAAGGLVILVTGRRLEDLERVCPLEPFACVVAENGALLHDARETRLLAAPPPDSFVRALAERRVPHARGHVIVATEAPHHRAVLEAIGELPLDVSLNKGAVMILPRGVDKASGLRAAANLLGLGLPEIVGIGDAENDQAFLDLCGLSAAVDGALPELRVDRRMRGGCGEGVAELVDELRRSCRS